MGILLYIFIPSRINDFERIMYRSNMPAKNVENPIPGLATLKFTNISIVERSNISAKNVVNPILRLTN